MSRGRRGGGRHKKNRSISGDREYDRSREALYHFLSAANEFGEDLPDGAWQAHIESAVEGFNEMNGTDYDPYDEFMAFVQRASAETKSEARP
jgi:hypothetical protein